MQVDAPTPRNIAQEGRDNLQAQIELAGPQYEARREYAGKYADLDVQNLRRTLLGSDVQPGLLKTYQDIQPMLSDMASEASRKQREQDVADVERLGARTVSAIRSADPITMAIEDALSQQAMDELGQGASVDPALARELEQGVRAAQAARGFGFGAPDAVVEAYSRGSKAEQLRRARQAFAQSVLAQRRAGATDPFLAIVGRQSSVPNMVGGAVTQGASGGAGAPSFDPFSQYASQLYSQNSAQAYDREKSNAAMGNALIGAGIEAAGSMAGGALQSGKI